MGYLERQRATAGSGTARDLPPRRSCPGHQRKVSMRVTRLSDCSTVAWFTSHSGAPTSFSMWTSISSARLRRTLSARRWRDVYKRQDLGSPAIRAKFREDLFYRLNVVTIRIPPLRERREDIPLLLAHYLGHASRRFQRDIPDMPADLSLIHI